MMETQIVMCTHGIEKKETLKIFQKRKYIHFLWLNPMLETIRVHVETSIIYQMFLIQLKSYLWLAHHLQQHNVRPDFYIKGYTHSCRQFDSLLHGLFTLITEDLNELPKTICECLISFTKNFTHLRMNSLAWYEIVSLECSSLS